MHTNQEVIDAAVEVVNLILGEERWPFEFWWKISGGQALPLRNRRRRPGCWRESALRGKGILLDTGHLMNACTELKTEAEEQTTSGVC